MRRTSRFAVTGMVGLGALVGASLPVGATQPVPAPTGTTAVTPRDEASAASPTQAERPAIDVSDLPVPADDVTTRDDDLRTTEGEVTVAADRADGTPVVTKLRTTSPKDADRLAASLSERRGVVAARTRSMTAMATPATTQDPLVRHQANLRAVGASGAWRWTSGQGVKVAVVDSGVDARHPDLAGRVTREIDLVPGGPTDPAKALHGTRVASLIAAGRNQVGIVGVAPAATIVPVTALDADGMGDTSTVARAIIAAANVGARVINLSLGGPDRDPVLDRAARYATSKGAVVVAAAGNSLQDGSPPQYPAASPTVVGVGSVDAVGRGSLFSNRGGYLDLAAPGEGILGAMPPSGYGRGTGTSFAAPQVSGALALVTAMLPGYPPEQIVRLALLTAQDDAPLNGHDPSTGYGLIRADRAVAAAAALRTTPALVRAPVRVERLNAGPEPLRAGSTAVVRAQLQTRSTDGRWRRSPIPYQIRIEFKADGAKAYVPVSVVGVSSGTTAVRVTVTESGRWRARVLGPQRVWTASRPDHIRVTR